MFGIGIQIIMPEIDIKKIDIFKPYHGSDYHACLGSNSSQSYDSYAIGYFSAAKYLLDKLIDQNDSITEHDLLINPILYSARHGVELCLKYILTKLSKTDIKVEFKITHSLGDLWTELSRVAAYDERLAKHINDLDHLIQQLDKADPEGQDFRYPLYTDGNPTQKDKTIVDIIHARSVIRHLSSQFEYIFDLVDRIALERQFGSYCNNLNREQLKKLSIELPPKSTWKDSEEFSKVKNNWQSKYNLSGRTFSQAIKFIESHSEFSGNIGVYHPFISVTDSVFGEIMDLAKKLQDHRLRDLNPDGTREISLEALRRTPKSNELYPKIQEKLTVEIVSDIKAIFYLSRDGCLSEEYENLYSYHIKTFHFDEDTPIEKEIRENFLHVFDKTNFINQVVKSLKLLGRLDLYDKYKDYIYEYTDPLPVIE